ncbi:MULTISPECIES: tetratricopeptide repeat-containing sensor histidine kinase [Aquimarina]|uniref:tetratricopeptide repeat-containing sensor histidine kinase n=1 Tax=Aquimarina TaxID=290174 RepID=UPI001356E305|nr:MULTISPECIES: tetratricopeptide repeat protein [Aquimarina]
MKNIFKLHFFVILFFVSAISLPAIQAQKRNVIDSLNSRLANSSGEDRASTLLALAKVYQNKDQKKTIKYAERVIELSEKINDQVNIGRAHTLIGDAYIITGKYKESAKHFEIAKTIFSTIKSEKDEANLYRYMGELYLKTHDDQNAKEYYHKSLTICKKINDTDGIAWSMNGLVEIYSDDGKNEKAKSFAEEALNFAKILNDNNLQINLHAKIADLIAKQNGSIEEVSRHHEKALSIAKRIDNPRAISGITMRRALFFSRRGKYDEGQKYYLEALKVCQKHGYYKNIINIYTNLGITALIVKGDYQKSLEYFGNALEISKQVEDQENEASLLGMLGAVHIEQGNYQKGIELLYESLVFYEKSNDKRELPGIYNNIGEAFFLLNDYKMAEENYKKSLAIFKEKNRVTGMMVANLNLGRTKVKQKEFTTAISYLDQVYNEFDENTSPRQILLYYDAMAECMRSQGKNTEALTYLNKALEMDKELGKLKKVAIELYTRLGMIYYELEDYKKSEHFFQKSLKLSLETKSRTEIQNNYFWLSKCYEKLNEHEKGLLYYKKYTSIKDSIFSLNKIKQIADIQIKYDTDKKEKEILLLQKEKEYQAILFNSQKDELYRVNLETDLEKERKERDIIQLKAAQRKSLIDQLNMENSLQIAEKEIQNNQIKIQKSQLAREAILRNIAIAGGILALLASFFTIMYYRQRLKTQKIIAKKEIEAINANHDGREKERERIAKELHDGIGGNLAAIKLDLNKLSGVSDSDLQTIIKNVNGTYNEVRALSHHLIPPKILNNTFEKLINDYLTDLSKTCTFAIHNDFFPPSGFNQLEDTIKIELYRITQELMSNIIKHAYAERVDLQFTILDETIKLIIEDDGIGFDVEKSSKGIGLSNISSRTKTLGGTMYIDTLRNRGTVIEINIPFIEKKVIAKRNLLKRSVSQFLNVINF